MTTFSERLYAQLQSVARTRLRSYSRIRAGADLPITYRQLMRGAHAYARAYRR